MEETKIRCGEPDEADRFVHRERDDAFARWRSGAGPVWIDAEFAPPDVKRELFETAGIAADEIAEMMKTGHASRVLEPFRLPFFDVSRFRDSYRVARSNNESTSRRLDRPILRASDLQARRYAYFITLDCMGAIALGMLWWFKRHGWMD